MGLREKLLDLRPNRTVKAVSLSNGETVYVPRLSLADAVRLDSARELGTVEAMAAMLLVIVRDDKGQKLFTDPVEAGECFTSDDATKLVNECMAFNALPTGDDSPNP